MPNDDSPGRPAPSNDDLPPVVPGSYSGTDFNGLRALFPNVEAHGRRYQYLQEAGRYNPKSLVGEIRADLEASQLDITAMDPMIHDAEEKDDYTDLAKIAPPLTSVRYRESLGPYNATLYQFPHDALNGAPDRVFRGVAGSISQPYLEGVDVEPEYNEFKTDHLGILARMKLLEGLRSQDKGKRIAAGKSIFDTYMSGLDNGSASEEIQAAFKDFVRALGLDQAIFQDETTDKFNGLVERLRAGEPGRKYLATVARGVIPEILQREFAGNLQDN
jgi:hypothetical protein